MEPSHVSRQHALSISSAGRIVRGCRLLPGPQPTSTSPITGSTSSTSRATWTSCARFPRSSIRCRRCWRAPASLGLRTGMPTASGPFGKSSATCPIRSVCLPTGCFGSAAGTRRLSPVSTRTPTCRRRSSSADRSRMSPESGPRRAARRSRSPPAPEAWTRRGTANDATISARALLYIVAGHTEHHTGLLKSRYGLQ
jgi:hypothetical protein